jgi:hypothetical protein
VKRETKTLSWYGKSIIGVQVSMILWNFLWNFSGSGDGGRDYSGA